MNDILKDHMHQILLIMCLFFLAIATWGAAVLVGRQHDHAEWRSMDRQLARCEAKFRVLANEYEKGLRNDSND